MFAVLKVAPLVFVGAVGLLLMQPERLAPAAVAPDDFLRSVLLLLFAFTGFETLTVPAEEALRPRSDLPMALLVTIGSVCAIYVLVHAAALGGLPSLAVEKAPLASLAGALFGEGGRAGMTAVAAVSMVGCSLLSLFGATRLLYAMSAAGEIPPFLGALDPKRRTPVVGSLLTGGLGAVLAILGGYAFLAAVSSGLRLLMYVACCLACLGRAASGSWSWRVAPMLVLASILLLLTALERREVVFGMIGIGAGLGLYLAARLGSRGSMTRREAV
jgi:amino acid transporter